MYSVHVFFSLKKIKQPSLPLSKKNQQKTNKLAKKQNKKQKTKN